jgi:hypothetical protein
MSRRFITGSKYTSFSVAEITSIQFYMIMDNSLSRNGGEPGICMKRQAWQRISEQRHEPGTTREELTLLSLFQNTFLSVESTLKNSGLLNNIPFSR